MRNALARLRTTLPPGGGTGCGKGRWKLEQALRTGMEMGVGRAWRWGMVAGGRKDRNPKRRERQRQRGRERDRQRQRERCLSRKNTIYRLVVECDMAYGCNEVYIYSLSGGFLYLGVVENKVSRSYWKKAFTARQMHLSLTEKALGYHCWF